MDDEFLALSFIFMLLGLTGIILFSSIFYNGSITPVMTPAGDGCYCVISSPEPGAAQGTSSILLALGVLFLPMGLMKGGLPTFRKPHQPGQPGIGVPGVAPLPPAPAIVFSLGFFVFGVVLLLVGIDVVLVPGYVVLHNFWYTLAGALLTAAGAISVAWGLGKPKGQ